MIYQRSTDEFEALIDEQGKITVPSEVRKRFGGRKLHVRLQHREISAALAKHDVTEEELQRIAAVQLESREQVVAFLMSEGSLRGNGAFSRRAARLWKTDKGDRR